MLIKFPLPIYIKKGELFQKAHETFITFKLKVKVWLFSKPAQKHHRIVPGQAMNTEKKSRNGPAGLKIRNICSQKTRLSSSPLVLPLIFGFSHKFLFRGMPSHGKMTKGKKAQALLLSKASNNCKRRKILHGNPLHLRSRSKNSPGKNSVLSALHTMSFIYVVSCIYPVFITHRWYDNSKKKQRRVTRNGHRK